MIDLLYDINAARWQITALSQWRSLNGFIQQLIRHEQARMGH